MQRRFCSDRKRRRTHLLFAAAAASTIGLTSAQALLAAGPTNWINTSSNWNTSGNWSAGQVPQAGDTVNIGVSNAATFTVTYNYTGSNATLAALTLNMKLANGTAALSQAGDTLVSTNENVGGSGAGSAGGGVVNQSGGANLVGSSNILSGLYLGVNATDKGVYNLSVAGTLYTPGGGGPQENIGENGVGVFNQSGGVNDISAFGNTLYLGENTGATGTYIFSAGSLLNAGGEYIGYSGTGIFNQSGGSLIDNGGGGGNYLDLGDTAGATGTYTLSGNGSIVISGPTQEREVIGAAGAGIFNQTGGTNTVGTSGSGFFEIAAFTGATGSYTLSGGTLTVNGNGTVGGANEPLGLGAGGTGILTVSNTGLMIVSGTLEVFSGNNSAINLVGGTIDTSALITNGVPSNFNWTSGTLGLTSGVTFDPGAAANSTSAAFGSSLELDSGQALIVTGNETLSGTAAFTLTLNGGTNRVNDFLTIGDPAGSTGTFILIAGSLTGGIFEYVGDSGTGNFNQGGGTNTAATLDIGLGAGSTGAYTLSHGTLNAQDENIGYSGAGTFNQSGGQNNGGSDLSSLTLGVNSGSTGTYNLSGTGAILVSGFECEEYVGYSGTGIFNQSGGMNTVSDALYIAYNAGSTGSYTLTGGTLSASAIYVGGTKSAAGGTGVLTISQTGSLSLAGTLQVWNEGRVNLDVPTTSVGNLVITKGLVNINGDLNINFGAPGGDPVTSIVSYLKSGYNGGAWTGTSGIISTSITGGSPALSIGYADGNTDSGTAAGPNQIVVRYTLAGDSNLDGLVNFNDLVAVVQNFNKAGTDWAHGNFGYGVSTDFNDLVTVVQNFNKILPPPSGSAVELGGTTVAVIQSTDVQLPEPAGLALAAVAAGGMFGRRKRKSSNWQR